MKGLYQKFTDILIGIIRQEYQVEIELPLWELPAKQEFGDLSSMAALKLASKLKGDPLEIAGHLKAELEKVIHDKVEKIEVLKPGFINIFLSREVLINSLKELLANDESFFRQVRPRKILLEFASANPTGPLSIAHGRQAVVGDVMANILKFFGNEVTKEYYVNDAGRQIDLFVESVTQRIKEIRGEPFQMPEKGYLGDYVKDIAQVALDGAVQPADMRAFVLKYNLDLIKKDLSALGIEFDNWLSQQKLLDEKRVDDAIAALKEKSYLYEKEDALWFETTKLGDDKDRVIKKNDGELTYFASDIAYHRNKLERGFDALINLWGPDHHGYIERVKASIQALGYQRESLRIIIIQLVTIKTKERMSRRKGTAILLSDLTSDVGKDTARFYYLVRKNSSLLEFDLDLAHEASFNNPYYYIQYSCARIESIFAKAGKDRSPESFCDFLDSEEELSLVRMILQFYYCIEKAYFSLEPVFIIEYLKALAAMFHKFYELKRIVGEEENIMAARLNLLYATRMVFHCALKLLGITPVKKM